MLNIQGFTNSPKKKIDWSWATSILNNPREGGYQLDEEQSRAADDGITVANLCKAMRQFV